MNYAKIAKYLIIILPFYLFFSFGHYDNNYREKVCYETATVVEITKVHYRSGWALLSNGETRGFPQPQPALVVGSEYCLVSARVRTAEPLPWHMFWLGK